MDTKEKILIEIVANVKKVVDLQASLEALKKTTSELTPEIKKLQDELSVLESVMSKLVEKSKDYAKNITNNKQANKELTTEIEKNAEKISINVAKQAELKEKYKLTDEEIKKQREELQKANVEMKLNEAILGTEVDSLERYRAVLKKTQADLSGLYKEENKLTQSIQSQKEAYEKLKTALDNGELNQDEYEKAVIEMDKLNKSIVENMGLLDKNRQKQTALGNEVEKLKVQIIDSSKATADHTEKLKSERKEATSAEGSYNQLSAQLALLKKRYKELSAEERDNSQVGKEMLKQIQDTDKKLKDLDQQQGVMNRNVGNYKESIKEAVSEMDLFGGSMGEMGQIFALLKSGLGTAIKGLTSFKMALISTGIGAIIVAVAALFTYLTKTESGMKTFKVITAGVGAVFNQLIGVLATAGKWLMSVFENPKQSLIDFVEFIKTNFMNRIQGVINIFKSIANMDFSNIGNDLAQVATGVTDVGGKLSKAKQAAIDFGNEIANAANQAMALEKLRQETEKQIRILDKSNSLLRAEAELKQAQADSDINTMQARTKLYDEALVLQQKASKNDISIAEKKLKLINDEIAQLGKTDMVTSELRDNQLEAEKAVIDAKKNALLMEQEIADKRGMVQLDLFDQEMDFVFDATDSRKTANEKIINDDTQTIEKRKALLKETQDMLEGAFNQEIALIEQYSGKRIDVNKLMSATNAKEIKEIVNSFGLSERINIRMLEMLRERNMANSDFAEAQKAIDKTIFDADKALMDKTKGLQRAQITDKRTLLLLEKQDEINAINESKANVEVKNTALLEVEKKYQFDLIQLKKDETDKLNEFNNKQVSNKITQLQLERDAELLAVKNSNDATEMKAMKNAEIEKRYSEQIKQERIKKVESALGYAQQLTEIVGQFQQAAMNRELAAAGENEAKKEEIKKKYAEKEKRRAIIQAVINGALGITQAFATNPFPLSLIVAALAAATTAAQIAVISSQKFATGGIVGGQSYTGDKVPIQVNSGEMILNKQQQSNMFDLLSNRNSFADNSMLRSMPTQATGKNTVTPVLVVEKLTDVQTNMQQVDFISKN